MTCCFASLTPKSLSRAPEKIYVYPLVLKNIFKTVFKLFRSFLQKNGLFFVWNYLCEIADKHGHFYEIL